MAETRDSATPWLAFLVGIVVVALIVVGVWAYNGGRPAEVAQLQPPQQINLQPPNVNVQPPAINVTPPPTESTSEPQQPTEPASADRPSGE